VQEAVRAWLLAHPASFRADEAARWLVAAQAPRVEETLRTALEHPDARRRMGLELGLLLGELGDRAGLDLVVESLPGEARHMDEQREPFGHDDWQRAEGLLRQAGAPAPPAPPAGREPAYGARAKQLGSWWRDAKDRVEWEASERRWTVRDAPR
jgi:hypothetical protein